MAFVISSDVSSDTLGSRTAWTAMSPSSSLGTNSKPNPDATKTLTAKTAVATEIISTGCPIA